MTGIAKDHSAQIKARKEKRLSHPIKDSEHRKKRLPNGFFDRRSLRVLALALLGDMPCQLTVRAFHSVFCPLSSQ